MTDASTVEGATLNRTAWHLHLHGLDLVFKSRAKVIVAHNALCGTCVVYKGYSYKGEFELDKCDEEVATVKKCTLWNMPEPSIDKENGVADD